MTDLEHQTLRNLLAAYGPERMTEETISLLYGLAEDAEDPNDGLRLSEAADYLNEALVKIGNIEGGSP